MIRVNHIISISRLSSNDADAIFECMLDKEISENTLVIPFPYTIEDAKHWLNDNLILEEETGTQKNFAIRNEQGILMGVIGIHFNYGKKEAKSEFGYWLGKKYWNRGVMTAVIEKFCEVAKEKYKLNMLEAHVFDFNEASMRILEKTGFTKTETKVERIKNTGRQVNAVRFFKNI